MNAEVACGVDIVEIERVRAVVGRWGRRFMDRVLTENEIAYCAGRPHAVAGRFAAKEAVSKALGTGIGQVRWKDIEVSTGPLGKPEITLRDGALRVARQQGIGGIEVSISHSHNDAIAMAVAWRER